MTKAHPGPEGRLPGWHQEHARRYIETGGEGRTHLGGRPDTAADDNGRSGRPTTRTRSGRRGRALPVIIEDARGDVGARFHETMTPARVDALTAAVNARIEAAVRSRGARADATRTEILALEAQAGHLVRYLVGGGESSTVRRELQALEEALAPLRFELAEIARTSPGRRWRS